MADDRDYTVAQFINDAKSILREEGETPESMAHVGSNLQRLTQRKDLLEQGTEIPSGVTVRSRLLHLEPNNTLHLAVGLFRRDQPTIETTLMHSHGSWGVFCGYQGREYYGPWERQDQEERRGYADLKQLEYRVLGPGDLTVMRGPPADIHTHTPIDEEFWILGFFGSNAPTQTRYFFTPQWRVSKGVPGRYAKTPGARLAKAERAARKTGNGG